MMKPGRRQCGEDGILSRQHRHRGNVRNAGGPVRSALSPHGYANIMVYKPSSRTPEGFAEFFDTENSPGSARERLRRGPLIEAALLDVGCRRRSSNPRN